MEKYQEFYEYMINSKQDFFIEAEGREDKIGNFIIKHNTSYSRNINSSTDGICILGDVDKWGVELRIYFSDSTDIPIGHHVQKNNIHRNPQYKYRLDDNNLVKYLFSQGCALGLNKA